MAGELQTLDICSFNMRGFTSGAAMLQELLSKHHIAAVQEHWLYNASLSKLSLINEQFVCFGVSGMTESLATGFLRGRPFGGVAFLWNNNLSSRIKVLGSDSDGRSVAISLDCGSRCILLINVYFP
jgi:exonuclease III